MGQSKGNHLVAALWARKLLKAARKKILRVYKYCGSSPLHQVFTLYYTGGSLAEYRSYNETQLDDVIKYDLGAI